MGNHTTTQPNACQGSARSRRLRGAFQGVPATGKRVMVPALATFAVDDAGLIVEAWLNVEMVGLLMQIGAIPLPS